VSISKKPYRGTRDFYPKQMKVRQYIFEKVKKAMEVFSYEQYDGPLLEEVELYKAKSGEELINEQIYSFIDRGNREVAIRPEMTPTLARMVASVHRETPKPIRWYSIPNLMRYEKPQKGRLREHWQINADIFGAPKDFGEIEVLQLLIYLFKSFGASEKQFKIYINDRFFVDAFFSQFLKLSNDQTYKLYKIVDKSKKVTSEKLLTMIHGLTEDSSQRSAIEEYVKINDFNNLESFAEKYELRDSLDSLLFLKDSLKKQNLDHFIQYDPTIVRGLDYYTGLVFEVFDLNPENKRALCGGGSYQNLLKIFNEPAVPGIGFGLGDVTLTDFLVTHNLLPELTQSTTQVLFASIDNDSISYMSTWVQKLRDEGINVELYPFIAKPKKVMNYALKKGIHHISIIGNNEKELEKIEIKNLLTRESSSVESIEEIISFLK